MKMALSLLVTAVLIGCSSYRSAPPADKNESLESANASSASSVPAPSNSPQPQTQQPDLWDPNDELHVAGKMLERVKQEGAIRIVSVHPLRDRYIFVAELEGEREGRSASDSTPKTDLWLVNRNGTGLQRLTYDGASYNPVWSPSGDEIAFVNRRYTLPILETMRTETGSDSARMISWGLCESCEFGELRWAPNGQAVAALENDGTTVWIRVILPDVGEWNFRDYPSHEMHNLASRAGRYQWSKESDLVLAYGRFAFDWEKVLSISKRNGDEVPQSESDEAMIAQSPESDAQRAAERAADPVRKSLLRTARKQGVARIEEYSPSPSSEKIAFVGGYEDRDKTDLWVVNRNGTGLRRLTTDVVIDKPVWSPSGSGIVISTREFFRDLMIVDARTGKQRDLLDAEPFGGTSCGWEFMYRNPRWSPNGKAINIDAIPHKESVGWSSSGGVVVVDARSGSLILFGSDLAWNDKGELVVDDYGRFVFDWNSALFKRH